MAEAQRVMFAMASLLFRIERESRARSRLPDCWDIESCLADDALAAVLHIEGAEAIDANFELLDVLYAAGLRRSARCGAARMRSATACRSAVRRRPTPAPV